MRSLLLVLLALTPAAAQSTCLHTPANPHPWGNIQIAPASPTWAVGVCGSGGCCSPFNDCHVPPPGIMLEGGQIGSTLWSKSWDDHVPQIPAPCTWESSLCCLQQADIDVWAIIGFNLVSSFPSPIWVHPPTTGTNWSMALWVDGTPYLTSHGNSSNGYHAIGFSVPNNVSYVGMPVYVQFVRRFSFLGVDRWQSSAANKTTIWQ